MKNIFILQLVDLCVTPPVCVVYFYCHTLERHVLFFIVLQQSQPGMMRLPKFGILIIYTFTRISFNVLSFIFFKLCTTCRLCKFSSRVMQVIIAISQCFHKAYIKTKKHTHTQTKNMYSICLLDVAMFSATVNHEHVFGCCHNCVFFPISAHTVPGQEVATMTFPADSEAHTLMPVALCE